MESARYAVVVVGGGGGEVRGGQIYPTAGEKPKNRTGGGWPRASHTAKGGHQNQHGLKNSFFINERVKVYKDSTQ